MIRTTLQKTQYLVYDTKTNNSITLQVSDDKMALFTDNGDDVFVFQNTNSQKNRAKWRNVAELIDKAIDEVEHYQRQDK